MSLTLKDIAKMVGVAESTVSRAINNKPGVGEETRKKIMKIVEKYDYQPNKMAQGLAKKETHLIALFLPELKNLSNLEIIQSVEEVMEKENYQVILCNTQNEIEKENKYLSLLEKNQIDGALIAGNYLNNPYILRLALNEDSHLVLLNAYTDEVPIPTVLIDNSEGGYLATSHLIEQGIERIGMVMGSEDNFIEGEKLSGYKRALNDYGISFDENLLYSSEGGYEDGYQAFLKLIQTTPMPQGFFISNNYLTLGFMEALKRGGYFVSQDFAVVSYGDDLLSSVISPSLTVVAEPLERLGELAGEYLIKLIKGDYPEEMIKVLNPVLKVRNSSNLKI